MPAGDLLDAIVVGGGPSGATMAWALARRGARVTVLEREVFPREKVCGDFIEPSGLRIIRAMGALEAVAAAAPQPIRRLRVQHGPHVSFHGSIPYYDGQHGLPDHARIIPREALDSLLLARARVVGAEVAEGRAVVAVRREDGVMAVEVSEADTTRTLRARVVIGADGTESVVARDMGLRVSDRRHISVSQRAYVEGVDLDPAEAAIFFDEDTIPGYGWMFPTADGRANFGVGLLGETCERLGVSVPQTFAAAVERLRIRHPGCAGARLASRPIGGVVKMYGAAGPNHFDGGLLIGDAGAFADPITGEGITQGMESALIAAETVLAALEAGRFDGAFLSRYETDFRAYFDPSMLYLDLCACIMRNTHLREFWMRSTRRGCERAQADPAFGRVAGASFGGADLQALGVIGQIASSVGRHFLEAGPRAILDLAAGRVAGADGLVGDMAAFERGWRASAAGDPAWHAAWLADVARAGARLQTTLWNRPSPRPDGPPLLRTLAGVAA
jgi:geranylgeranyl reductase family protein